MSLVELAEYLKNVSKTPVSAADTLNDQVLPFLEEHDIPMLRVQTDRGTGYCGRVTAIFTRSLIEIELSRTKANGICERFHQTRVNQFYKITFRGKRFTGTWRRHRQTWTVFRRQ